jgi:hypothetical protein
MKVQLQVTSVTKIKKDLKKSVVYQFEFLLPTTQSGPSALCRNQLRTG